MNYSKKTSRASLETTTFTTRSLIRQMIFVPLLFSTFLNIYDSVMVFRRGRGAFLLSVWIVFQWFIGIVVYKKSQLANVYQVGTSILWFCCSMGLVGTAIFVEFKLWHNTFCLDSLLVLLYGIVFSLIFRLYRVIWEETLPSNLTSGRFDLTKGLFSPLIQEAKYQFKSSRMALVSTFLGANAVLLAVIGANLGLRTAQSTFSGKELIAGIVTYGCGLLSIFGVVSRLYTYLWIRRWEKQTGRTMWIKGFEPGGNQK